MSTAPNRPASRRETKDDADLAGCNVQVIIRCRPLTVDELAHGGESTRVVHTDESRREVMVAQNVAGKQMTKKYTFDQAFGGDCTQQHLYEKAVAPLVEEVLKGFNCTIFAYGQTGTGKTHTMEGKMGNGKRDGRESEGAGVIPRAVQHIFDALQKSSTEYSVRVSFLELYNEELQDLLYDDDTTDDRKPLRILEDARRGISVQNLQETIVTNVFEIFQLLEQASAKRRTAETFLNKFSSRSHSIFTITIHMKETATDGEDFLKIGKLNLVDLAGSENIGRSGAANQRAKEAGMINQSLLTLGRVITALVEHWPHIPYRDSKLTRLLQDSLGGRTKTCIIATVSPSLTCLEETFSTMEYAHRAKNIKNKPELNQTKKAKGLVKEYLGEIEALKNLLAAHRDKDNAVCLPSAIYAKMEYDIVEKGETIKSLEAQIEQKENDLKQLMTLFDLKNEALEKTSKQLNTTQEELRKRSEELEQRAQELKATRLDLQDKCALLIHHSTAEEELSKDAERALQAANVAVHDISGLLEKIDRKQKLDDKNKAAVISSRSALRKQLAALADSCKDHQQSQLSALSSLQAAITSVDDIQSRDTDHLAGQVAELQEDFVARLNDITLAVRNYIGEEEKKQRETRQTVTANADSLISSISALRNDFTSRLSLVVDGVKELQTKTSGFVNTSSMTVMEAQEQVLASVTEEQNGFAQLEESLDSFLTTVIQTNESRLRVAREKFAAQKEVRQQSRENVQARISELLAEAARQEDECAEALNSDFVQGAEFVTKELQTFHGNFLPKIRQASQATGERWSKQSVCFDRLGRSVVDVGEAIVCRLGEEEQHSAVAIESLNVACDNLTTQATQQQANLQVVLQSETSRMSTFGDAATSRSAELLSSECSKNRDLQTQIAASRVEIKDAFEKIQSEILNDRKASNDMWQDLGTNLQRAQDSALAIGVEEYLPTGKTPIKRDFDIPRGFPRSRPDEEVIQAIRAGLPLPPPMIIPEDAEVPAVPSRQPLGDVSPNISYPTPKSPSKVKPLEEPAAEKPSSRSLKQDPPTTTGIPKFRR